jgi:chorismate mutase
VTDPLTEELRSRIAEQDRTILAAVNARLRFVAQLKEHKSETGAAFADPDQEERLLQALVDANAGPVSQEGVRKLFEEILALTKRELR